MDLDEFDEFELEDMSRVPARPDKPLRPKSQMFEEPLHIENDEMSSGGFGSAFDNPGDFNGYGGLGPPDMMSQYDYSGQHAPPPAGVPMFIPGENSNYTVTGSRKRTWLETIIVCCAFCWIFILLIIIIILCAIILWKTFDITDDLNNLKFKIQVPTTPPANARPPQISGN